METEDVLVPDKDTPYTFPEIAERIVEWFFVQRNGLSATLKLDDDDGPMNVCMYRGSAGTACAVGCLIPDTLYQPYMEEQRVWNIVTESSGLAYLFNPDIVFVLTTLQVCHDNSDESDFQRTFLSQIRNRLVSTDNEEMLRDLIEEELLKNNLISEKGGLLIGY